MFSTYRCYFLYCPIFQNIFTFLFLYMNAALSCIQFDLPFSLCCSVNLFSSSIFSSCYFLFPILFSQTASFSIHLYLHLFLQPASTNYPPCSSIIYAVFTSSFTFYSALQDCPHSFTFKCFPNQPLFIHTICYILSNIILNYLIFTQTYTLVFNYFCFLNVLLFHCIIFIIVLLLSSLTLHLRLTFYIISSVFLSWFFHLLIFILKWFYFVLTSNFKHLSSYLYLVIYFPLRFQYFVSCFLFYLPFHQA